MQLSPGHDFNNPPHYSCIAPNYSYRMAGEWDEYGKAADLLPSHSHFAAWPSAAEFPAGARGYSGGH